MVHHKHHPNNNPHQPAALAANTTAHLAYTKPTGLRASRLSSNQNEKLSGSAPLRLPVFNA
ncbi:hypothetical protein A9A89_2069 [Bifidobacterium psychraerophilum DSM 22366]|nr:hypothetical protein A9A89_2069 [Bifidobacterium psychraerophilum DSM 22366]